MVKNVLAKEFGEELLKKNIKDIPEFVYKEVMKRSTKVGTVSNEALERFAIKKRDLSKRYKKHCLLWRITEMATGG